MVSMGGHKTKEKTVTVALKDIAKLCHHCGKVKDSTRRRNLYTKAYQGPCGDSFCYASCDLEECRPVDVTVCNECEVIIKK